METLRSTIAGLFVLIFIGVMVPSSCASLTPRQQYISADRCFLELKKNPENLNSRKAWVNCIELYQRVYADHPESSWAPAGMYRTAQLYLDLSRRSLNERDRSEAVDLLNRIQGHYPKSAYKDRSIHLLKQIAVQESKKDRPQQKIALKKSMNKGRNDPGPGRALPPSRKKSKPAPEPSARVSNLKDSRVTGLRFWSNPEYTRVVIDADENRTFSHNLLKRDPALKKPQRLYIDLDRTRLGKGVPKHTAINDDLLIQARAGQHTPHSVRVVIDIKAFDNYKVFSLNDPFRLVIDVWSKTSGNGKANAAQTATPLVTTDNILSSSIAKQLVLGVRKIVIDPGHGGKDPGAPGYLKGVWEKDVVLQISKRLAARMRDRLQCDVTLTRSTDTYLTLEERTAIANTRNADLFISLHCNAAKNKKLTGMETYFLNLATDDESITMAARENATSRKNISDLESILNDLMKNAKVNESSRLASKVQASMCAGLEKKYSNIRNLGVKQAPFYVLLGARMPSILVEAAFLSNRTECKRLVSAPFQERLCDAIIDGVEQYIKETNPQTL